MKKKMSFVVAGLLVPTLACAEYTWTPLITASMFDGIRADVILGCGSIFVIGLIIYGISVLNRTVR